MDGQSLALPPISVPVNAPLITTTAKELVREALESGWISGGGPMVERFERGFAERISVRHAIATSSGTAALHLALATLGIGPGDEVIVPDFTMIATANAVLYTGATPVFVDVEADIYTLDPERVAAAITPRTRAILPVHLYGHSADMDPLRALADRHGLHVVEDAAQAHGARYRGRACGALGDLAAFSFYANKIITTGEGGMLTTDDAALATRARSLRDMAHRPGQRFVHDDLGFSYRMGSLQAALGLGQTQHLAQFLVQKRWLAAQYHERLAGIPGLHLPVTREWAENVHWMYAVRIDARFALTREQLRAGLRALGIETRVFFQSCASQPMIRARLGAQPACPVSERIAATGLYLPSGLGLTPSELDYVCARPSMRWPPDGLRDLANAVRRTLFLASRMRWRHLRAGPLVLTVALSHLLFSGWPSARSRSRRQRLDWRPGISVVIPERGGIDLLDRCLDALAIALTEVAEPTEIIVVVNGSPASDYRELAARYPDIRWSHHPHALGFTRAVLEGVALARHGGIYLLNNDMCLEPAALAAVLAERDPAVFAIASQILFPDDGRRREETGWTHMPMVAGLPAPRHDVAMSEVVRGTVWAGAGSALFHAGLLRELLPGCLPYDPFYWEDVDLGVRAWRLGYESLYCPASRALHLHRVTVNRFYSPAEVERIFERNRLQFQLRNPFPRQPLLPLLLRLTTLDPNTLSELGNWRACRTLWRTRAQACRAPFRDLDYADLPLRSYRHRPNSGARPTLLLVSPFAILPPRHGGAVRTQRLAVELARDFDLILLSDERALHGDPADPAYAPFASVHLVDGRPQLPIAQADDRVARIHQHAHAALRLELERLLTLRRPCAVLVEHMELAGLVEVCAAAAIPCVLSLQDVQLQPQDPAQAAADRFERALIERFDAVVVSSREDQALLEDTPSVLVPNGCDPPLAAVYRPSTGRNILFVGPFRAAINWHGIHDFVATVYPAIEARVPGVSLTIIGGPGAQLRAATEPGFARASIQVLDTIDSVDALLSAAALTINPQPTLRGSSIKVLESLSAGRVCVSTLAGARGHLEASFPGLVVCPRLADFESRLIELLLDPDARHALETPDLVRLSERTWERSALPLRELLAGWHR